MWREIGFIVELDQVEAWSDALLEAGAASVQAEDADADSADEQALFGEPGMPQAPRLGWNRTRLTALMPQTTDSRQLLTTAAALLDVAPPQDLTTRVFGDEDWVRLTQSQFEPIQISPRLLITPTWHLSAVQARIEEASSAPLAAGAQSVAGGQSEAGAQSVAGGQSVATAAGSDTRDRVMIVLDPGLAFGTGSHPTTRLCLQWLERHLKPGQSVLDYGCGSGILAIAARKLGAGRVIGVDIDDQAVLSSRDNALANNVDIEFRSTRDAAPEAADIVVANILATPLKLLAPLLEAFVRPGGHLILAGLLERQIEEVASCYRSIQLSAWGRDEGWACLAGSKGATATGS